jgi:gliding motility-associated-like protein
MQLGPDGKIYMSMRWTGGTPNIDLTISVIEEPNKPKEDCRYRMNLVKTTEQARYINYNYIRSGSFSLEENGIQVQKRTCADRPTEFRLLFNRVDSVKWDFGDPASGAANFSTSKTPQHFYPSPGTYNVRAIIYSNCFTDTAYKQVEVQPDVAVKVPEFVRDTFACKGQHLKMDVRVPNANAYLWENGLIFSDRVFDTGGRMSISIFNDCSFDRRDFVLQIRDCPCEVFVPTAFTPNNDGLNDIFKPAFQCFAVNYKMRVYSRWGDIVFESRQTGTGWNGKKRDLTLPTGVYVWMIEYQNPNTKEKYVKKGTVTLIR